MRFDRESYRKLYVRESADDASKPIFFRGLRDYLLRKAKDDGTLLASTTKPVEDLGRALAIHGSERKPFKAFIEDLIASGYLTLEGGRLWITRFEEAQEARSKGAKRQEEYLKRKKAKEAEKASHTDAPDDVSDDVTDDAQEASHETSPLAELTDETRDPPKPPPIPELQRRAADWLRLWEHSHAGKQDACLKHGMPYDWPEVQPIWAAMLETFGHDDKPMTARDTRNLAVVTALADGYQPDRLAQAVRGSPKADYISEKRDLQTVTTILKDGSRIDRYAALAKPAPTSGPQASDLVDDVLDDEARREAAYDRRKLDRMRSEGRHADAEKFEAMAAQKHGAAWIATAPTEAA